MMSPLEFKIIRIVLGWSQRELAQVLGYKHKIRISEYERDTNPVAIPPHIAKLMLKLKRHGGKLPPGRKIRAWKYRTPPPPATDLKGDGWDEQRMMWRKSPGQKRAWEA